MRLIRLVPAALILCMAAPAFGQEWIEYYSRPDAFLVNFPKQPQVRDIPYPTEFRGDVAGPPAHRPGRHQHASRSPWSTTATSSHCTRSG